MWYDECGYAHGMSTVEGDVIESLCELAKDFDIDAICEDLKAHDFIDCGEWTEKFYSCNDEFWAIVEAHDISGDDASCADA